MSQITEEETKAQALAFIEYRHRARPTQSQQTNIRKIDSYRTALRAIDAFALERDISSKNKEVWE